MVVLGSSLTFSLRKKIQPTIGLHQVSISQAFKIKYSMHTLFFFKNTPCFDSEHVPAPAFDSNHRTDSPPLYEHLAWGVSHYLRNTFFSCFYIDVSFQSSSVWSSYSQTMALLLPQNNFQSISETLGSTTDSRAFSTSYEMCVSFPFVCILSHGPSCVRHPTHLHLTHTRRLVVTLWMNCTTFAFVDMSKPFAMYNDMCAHTHTEAT